MPDFWYTPAKQRLAKADLDFDLADLRAILCMSNTTAVTQEDAATLSAITTLDEFNGAGYSRLDFTGITVVQDNAANRSEIHVADGTFGAAVSAGTRNIIGLLYYVHVDGTAVNDYPVAWKDLTPFNANGGAINFSQNAEGLLQVA